MSASRFHRTMVQCPRCLNDIDAVIWDVIDAGTDPDLKERLLQKKVQQQVCLNCGHAFILAEPLLYRHDQHRLLAFYAPGASAGYGPDAAAAPATDRHAAPATDKPSAPATDKYAAPGTAAAEGGPAAEAVPDPASLKGWHLRRVSDYNSLIETIHIFDHNCDDRLMAVVKVAIQTQGCLDPEPTAVFFLTADGTAMRFVARTREDEWFTVDYPPDIYTNTEEVFKDALEPEQGWLTVDTAYGADLVRQQTERLERKEKAARG